MWKRQETGERSGGGAARQAERERQGAVETWRAEEGTGAGVRRDVVSVRERAEKK